MVLGVLDCRTSEAVRQWFHTAIVSVFGTPALVRTDQGSEFKGDFAAFCSEADITHVVIPTESPWSNGVAERLVITLTLGCLIHRIFQSFIFICIVDLL